MPASNQSEALSKMGDQQWPQVRKLLSCSHSRHSGRGRAADASKGPGKLRGWSIDLKNCCLANQHGDSGKRAEMQS